MRVAACCLMLHASWPALAWAQPAAATPAAPTGAAQPSAPPGAAQETGAEGFNLEQIDALVAPIALYPDPLLTQLLMASTYPLEIVQAARWAEDPAHKGLTGDALTKALEPEGWDPSVKSLVPFPQVLATMNGDLNWTQQLGYAFAGQQAEVMNSVQRLRRQAQDNGNLKSTPQQVVEVTEQNIVIEPAESGVVYVPSYNPSVVYEPWPYPSYPPVYPPPPPGYAFGTALATGLAFGAGIAITAGLWNWARPSWGGGYVNVNAARYNNINVNRGQINSNVWQGNRPGGRPAGMSRPPSGPVGRPARSSGLPAGAIGRSQVSVPGSAVRPSPRSAASGNVAGARPGAGGGGAARPGAAAQEQARRDGLGPRRPAPVAARLAQGLGRRPPARRAGLPPGSRPGRVRRRRPGVRRQPSNPRPEGRSPE